MKRKKKMVLSFAHPDDETFATGGTVSKYSDNGWKIDLLCATRGEKGKSRIHEDIDQESLAEVREQELQKAVRVLNIQSVSFLGYKDGELKNETRGELEDKIYKHLVEKKPSIVITFGPKGISNHPDHIKISRATTYAFQKYAKWNQEMIKKINESKVKPVRFSSRQPAISFQELQKLDINQSEPRLYYVVMSESTALFLRKIKQIPEISFGKPWIGTHDKFITTIIDITRYANKKKKALLCHDTQIFNWIERMTMPHHPSFAQEQFILRMEGVTEIYMGRHDTISDRL